MDWSQDINEEKLQYQSRANQEQTPTSASTITPLPKLVLVDSSNRVRELTGNHARHSFPQRSVSETAYNSNQDYLQDFQQYQEMSYYNPQLGRHSTGQLPPSHLLSNLDANPTQRYPSAMKGPSAYNSSASMGMTHPAPGKLPIGAMRLDEEYYPMAQKDGPRSPPRLPSLNAMHSHRFGALSNDASYRASESLMIPSRSNLNIPPGSLADVSYYNPPIEMSRSLPIRNEFVMPLPGSARQLSFQTLHSSTDDHSVGIESSESNSERATTAARIGRICRFTDCTNIARSKGLCRTHGGGKRCSTPGCNKSAQANRKCIAHGGGTRCSHEDCEKTAQSRGLCKAHGGGARCKHPQCPKSSQSRGLCRGHGGGIKCKEPGCEKWVQRNGYCIKHGRERASSMSVL